DPPDTPRKQLFQARYRGKRYSFGYPACPDLEQQTELFDLLRPQDIGVELTEGFMMEPEASVSALVFYHPDATYFSAGVGEARAGWKIPRDSIPMSLENVHTDYGETRSAVTFRVSNGNNLTLHFINGECLMFADARGRPILGTSGFRTAFPLNVSVVPVLGPVE